MHPVPVGAEVHDEGIAKTDGRVCGQEEVVVYSGVYGAAGNHDLVVVVTKGFHHYSGYGFEVSHKEYRTEDSCLIKTKK